jgi:hypothetical protein
MVAKRRNTMRLRSSAKRARLIVDVSPSLRRRLRVAAARRNVTVAKYVLTALERQLQQDLRNDLDAILALTAAADPVLAAFWDNPKDAAYDRL